MSSGGLGFLEGGGVCARLIGDRDWESSPVGAISSWPPALVATVANMLHTRQPMLLFWGPDLVQFYNDAFVPSFGQGKHPHAMGQLARDCWADAWPVIGAQIEAVMSRGEPAWYEDALVPIHRNGRMEEVFWTYSYSPAFDDVGAVHGTLVIVTEMTGRVLFARRLEALSLLGMKLWSAASHDAVFDQLGLLVARWASDVPFVVVRDASGQVRSFGIELDAASRLAAATPRSSEPQELVIEAPTAGAVPGAVWPEPIERVLTCEVGKQHQLIMGLSPRLPFDDAYRSFLAQIAGQIDVGLRHVDDANALHDASRLKDEFLAMLGHELRNPLAPIVTALDLMREKNLSGGPERAVIERQVRHVIRLVDDLLDISKITRGVVDLDRKNLDMRTVISAAVEAGRHLVTQRKHRLFVEAYAPVFVLGDEFRLTQVVLNLLTNAARYTPEGGTIRVRLIGTGADAIVEVEDNGVGMSSELIAKVFDTFVQGARRPDRAEGGLGLGLSIARNLISLHGGSVAARSDGPGKGSLFTIRLERVEGELREPVRVRTPIVVEPRRILVVDDNEDAADLLGELARTRGHDVTVVHDPVRALDIVGELQPQIAVLDIGLPGMDGYELATRMRALCPSCQLVALTGYGQDSDRVRAREAGFIEHLVKPVRVEQLLAVIGQIGTQSPASAPT